MIFSSTLFLFVFLPITIAMYFFANDKMKNIWLLIASLFFYSWGEPKYIVLMLASITANYFFGIMLEKQLMKQNPTLSKMWLILAVVFDLGILLYFKYFNFFVDNINSILSINIAVRNIALPVGISFFTFQIMSYVIDVYWGNVKAQKNIFNLGLYISLFPQLIAGPIVRYIDIEKQINERRVNFEQIYRGVRVFMIGFSKKILIADQLAPFADTMFAQNGISAPSAWTGILAYTLQIYFDFSGYSDMAIGLGCVFGFDFIDNFNYPYISKSIKEFWRRWHISLSTWFRDYVYIPLGGSRCKPTRTYFNLCVVFFLTGFWHGASWNFVVWGLYYGMFLIAERMGMDKILKRLPTAIQHLYAIIIILIGWVFFRAETLGNAILYIKNMFVVNERCLIDLYINMNKQYVFCLVLGIFFSFPVGKTIYEKLSGKYEMIYDILVGIVFIISISYMMGSGFSPFLYFRF